MAGKNRFPNPRRVKIVKIAPGDELQNEALLDTDTKVDFIHCLSETGPRGIEVTSFISPLVIPQDGDAEQIYYQIRRQPDRCQSFNGYSP
jgi:hydroxymethylglutaryl-CoA lyase